jgi:hypothetical protein
MREGQQLSERLDDLAHRVRGLIPSHRDPERFHEDKSAIEAELRQLSRSLARSGGRDARAA